jgi:hypothetical protein
VHKSQIYATPILKLAQIIPKMAGFTQLFWCTNFIWLKLNYALASARDGSEKPTAIPIAIGRARTCSVQPGGRCASRGHAAPTLKLRWASRTFATTFAKTTAAKKATVGKQSLYIKRIVPEAGDDVWYKNTYRSSTVISYFCPLILIVNGNCNQIQPR